MTPLDRLRRFTEQLVADILPGSTDNALEDALVDAEAETEVHEPKFRGWTSDWKRIAQSLGIDERDATWRSAVGTLWRWDESRWWHSDHPNIWIATPHDYRPDSTGPFVATDLPTTAIPYVAMDLRMSAMDWRGWAVPAILECLAQWPAPETEYDTYEEWCEGIAPKIADRIACDPERALDALYSVRNDRLHQ